MKRIIVEQDPSLLSNLKALATAPGLINALTKSLLEFKNETGIDFVDINRNQSVIEFIESIDQHIPNSDKFKQLGFRVDFVNDNRSFTEWAKKVIVEREGSKLAGLALAPEAMASMIALPEETISDLLEAKRNLDSFRFGLPQVQVFWQFMTIVDGKNIVSADAKERLTDSFTSYANKSQSNFLKDVTEILDSLSILESQYYCKGLTLRSTKLQGNNYVFNLANLKEIQ